MKPILFNTEMVKAILDGRKTVTRRVIKPQPVLLDDYAFAPQNRDRSEWIYNGYRCRSLPCNEQGNYHECKYKPPCKMGDILWVRETWCDRWLPDGFLQGCDRYGYKADGKPSYGYWGNDNQCKHDVWIPSIHMPKKAARILLKVKDVRAERLQDIDKYWSNYDKEGMRNKKIENISIALQEKFIKIWNSVIKKLDFDRYCWDADPWVWVVEFERIENTEAEK